MNSGDQQYYEIIAGMAQAEKAAAKATETDASVGVKWGYKQAEYDGRPLIGVFCSKCKTTLWTEQADFTWEHCGIESVVPEKLNKRLVAMQVKLGLRKPENFIKKLFTSSEIAPPVLNNF